MIVNSTDPKDAEKSMIAELERMGPQRVREKLKSGSWGQNSTLIDNWLAKKDREAAQNEAASQADIAGTASRSAVAAERTAKAAEEQAVAANAQARTAKRALITSIVAVTIAAVALAVSILVALHVLK